MLPLSGAEPVSCNLEHGIVLAELYQIIISLPFSISSCLLAVKFEMNVVVVIVMCVVMTLTACHNYILLQAPGIESKL